MHNALLRRHLPALLIAVPALAAAQGKPPAKAGPLDAAAAVPRVAHQSSLRTVPRQADAAVGDWRAANDTVTRIGGWRSYLREAQAPAPGSASAPNATPSAPPVAPPAERRP